MLLSLSVRQFAIIDHAEIALGTGMTALTGETGAGKSLLVDALLLLSGSRADSAFVKHGAERAEIVAQFDLTDAHKAREWLAEHELDQGDECLLRRVIRSDGNSKAWINGTAATLANLGELTRCLIEIHGQHEAYALLQRAAQLELLDAFAACTNELNATKLAFEQWQALDEKIRSAERQDLRDEHLALLQHEASELARDVPTAEAIEELFAKHKRLANHGELLENAERLAALFDGEDGIDLCQALAQAQHEAQQLAKLDPELTGLLDMLEGARIQIDEAQTVLDKYRDAQELDPNELQQLDARLTRLHDLARKHRVPMEGLADKAARLQEQAQALLEARSSLDAWREARTRAEAHYRAQALALSHARAHAAHTLAHETTNLMQSLAMQGGVFQIELQHEATRTPAPNGTDSAEFLVSANPGQPPRALKKVASGGELARISLALEVAAQGRDPVPTLVFDEVDTGIGGAVAESVGKQLRALAHARQVLCVTHLPQVAAQAHAQISARKINQITGVSTELIPLDASARVEELARMLGGEQVTEASRENARVMLKG